MDKTPEETSSEEPTESNLKSASKEAENSFPKETEVLDARHSHMDEAVAEDKEEEESITNSTDEMEEEYLDFSSDDSLCDPNYKPESEYTSVVQKLMSITPEPESGIATKGPPLKIGDKKEERCS